MSGGASYSAWSQKLCRKRRGQEEAYFIEVGRQRDAVLDKERRNGRNKNRDKRGDARSTSRQFLQRKTVVFKAKKKNDPKEAFKNTAQKGASEKKPEGDLENVEGFEFPSTKKGGDYRR